MRVAIVNDLGLAREVLRRLVLSVPGFQVAWTAADGQQAVEKVATDPPDVILMDLVMPVLDGVEATRRIMHHHPCPILVTTAYATDRISLVYEAMNHGALDVFTTPNLGPDYKILGGDDLRARLERLARGRGGSPQPCEPQVCPVLALGASTGGPDALAAVLAGLPPRLSVGVVVIQHISADFAGNLVHRLQSATPFPVRLAREGDTLRAGEVLVAGTDDHLIVRPDLGFGYTREPAGCPYRPSVDVFFQSLARHWPRAGAAVLLTGMGRDGAQGMAQLRQAKWLTVAQAQEGCVVYGMPRAAVELNAAAQVLPLEHIAQAVGRAF
jgi:two-component system response regulator WspF